MNDILILSSYGIDVSNLEKYEIVDETSSTIYVLIRLLKDNVSCPHCKNQEHIKIKDYKKKKYVLVNPNGKTLVVYYEQRRYICSCNKSFLEKNPFIRNKNYKIDSLKIHLIVEYLKRGHSINNISSLIGVSTSSVFKVIDRYIHVSRNKLSTVLCVDEFLAFGKDIISGKYPCLLVDGLTHKIIDLIRSRRKDWIEQYFANISKDELNNVKYIITDMHYPFKDTFKKYFPYSIMMIDRFHFVRYVTQAIDLIRRKVMSYFDKNSDYEYKLLKTNRNILLTKHNILPGKKKFISYLNGYYDKSEILQIILDIDKELNTAYKIGHMFLNTIDNIVYNDASRFIDATISMFQGSGINEFIEVASTFKNWRNEIINSFITLPNNQRLSNGPIEGINNKIKTLKKISYGIANFDHLRKRILLYFNK